MKLLSEFQILLVILFLPFLTVEMKKILSKANPIEFDDLFDHVFFITIKNPKRYNNVKRIITMLKTKNYSIIGINGTEVLVHSDHPLKKLIGDQFRGKYSATELGCALSHRLAFEIVSSGNYKHALILQDNIHVKVQLFLELVQRYRQFIQPSWQIVHWHSE